MGWTEQIERTIREDADAQKASEKERAALIARAEKVGLDPYDFYAPINGQMDLDIEVFEHAIEVEEVKAGIREATTKDIERDKKDDRKGTGRPPPKDLPEEAVAEWEAADTDAEKNQIYENATAAEVPDSFGDQQYADNYGWNVDKYMTDMGEDVSPQRYRTWLMREDGDAGSQYTATPMSQLGGFGGARKGKLHVGTTKGITPQKYVARVNSMSPDELEELQRDLYAAGFYGSVSGSKDQEPMWGAPDEPTIAAVKLLSYTTMRFGGKYSIVEVIDLFKAKADKNGDGTPDAEEKEKRKPVIQLTNPTDLADAAQNRAVDLMGRRLQGGEVQGAIGGYNQQEAAYQTAAQMAEIDNTGGTFTAPASPSAYTEERIRAENAPEVDSYTYLGVVNALMQRLGLAG